MNQKIAIIGVPQDLGASRRGVDMGPSAIRVAGLHRILSKKLNYEVIDYGNIKCHDIAEHFESIAFDPKLRHLDQIIETSKLLKGTIENALSNNCFPVVLGGDHSLNIGTLAGLKSHRKDKIGMLWIDAHGDFNIPETSPSGNIHGMPFAVALGKGCKELVEVGGYFQKIQPRNAVLLGARNLDGEEQNRIRKSEISVFTMEDIDRRGICEITEEAVEIATRETDALHLSLDMDALDPQEAPGVGTPVRGGLTYREAHTAMEIVSASRRLFSLEVVEVNPILDIRNTTAEVAAELVESALGKRII